MTAPFDPLPLVSVLEAFLSVFLGALADLLRYLDAHYWYVWVGVTAYALGRIQGLTEVLRVNERHLDTLRKMTELLGYLEGAAEVLEEHDLGEEGHERGKGHAVVKLIELRHKTATEPSRLDRLRERLPF